MSKINVLDAAESLQESIDKGSILTVLESNNSNLVHIETSSDSPHGAGQSWATMTKGSKKTRLRRASQIVKALNRDHLFEELVEELDSLYFHCRKDMSTAKRKKVEDLLKRARGEGD